MEKGFVEQLPSERLLANVPDDTHAPLAASRGRGLDLALGVTGLVQEVRAGGRITRLRMQPVDG